jgi:hypothetical protein
MQRITKAKMASSTSIVEQQEQSHNGTARDSVYVVVENGELYPSLYYSYEDAREAVLDKHAETLEESRSECAEWGGVMASQVDVAENKETGTTRLYVEKDIHIIIQRYKVSQ